MGASVHKLNKVCCCKRSKNSHSFDNVAGTSERARSTEVFRPAVDVVDDLEIAAEVINNGSEMSAGKSASEPRECHMSSIEVLRSELMHNKEVSVTFSDCMFDHLLLLNIHELEKIAEVNHVSATYKNRRFVGISGKQADVDNVQARFLELTLQKHEELCKQLTPAGKAVNLVAQSESLERGTDASGSSVDGPTNREANQFTSLDPEASTSNGSSDTEYIDIEQHIWNYILYKNCNLIGEFGAKYDCSISAIPCDSRSVKMCKVAIRSSNKDKLHEAVEEIAELCRVLMVGDIVEYLVNFPSSDDLEFFQSQLKSLDVQVASSPCRLIGPSKNLEQAKFKFETAVQAVGRNIGTLHGECNARNGENTQITAPVVSRDFEADLLRFETRSGLIVHVRKGNIIEQKTEAIVDAANIRLHAGSGVAKAIADAAGKQVEDECRKYIKDHGELRTAEPMHTSAGNLRPHIRFIIHIAGPDSSHYRDKNVCHEQLQKTFLNCLQYANGMLEITSLAIPAISSGVYRVPKEVVARRAYAALMDYDSHLLENPKLPRRLRDIHFVNIDAKTTQVMEQVLREMSGDATSCPPPYLSPAANTQNEIMQHVVENQREVAGVRNGNAHNSPMPGAERGSRAAGAAALTVSDVNSGDQKYPSGNEGLPRQNSRNKPGDAGSGSSPKSDVSGSNSLSAYGSAGGTSSAKGPSEQGEAGESTSAPPENIDAGSGAKVDESHGGNASQPEQCKQPLGHVDQGATADRGTEDVKSIRDDIQGAADRTPGQQDAAAAAYDDDDADPAGDDNVQQGAAKAVAGGDDKDEKTSDTCVICMDKMENPLKLDCGHVFCEECIAGCFEKHQPKCPSCGLLYGVLRGNQPTGTFRHSTNKWSHLSGYEKYGTIEITYNFPGGIQSDEHPNPGVPYKGTSRTALLPDSPEGREVLELLRRAFDARLLFTIDRSVTTGQENVIVWNDIHQKTKATGEHGYPDPGYLDRVKAELAAKGIKPDAPVVEARKRNKNK